MRCAPKFLLLPAAALVVGAGTLWWQRTHRSSTHRSDSLPAILTRQERLQRQLEGIQQRMRAKEAIVLEVIAGHLTLRQAAARFQELDIDKPTIHLGYWRATYPGDTDEERYCCTILRSVEIELSHNPQQARAVRQRLEAELPPALRRRLAPSLQLPTAHR
jgi:hypothetical protein